MKLNIQKVERSQDNKAPIVTFFHKIMIVISAFGIFLSVDQYKNIERYNSLGALFSSGALRLHPSKPLL